MLKYLIPLLVMDVCVALLARTAYETGSAWALVGSTLALMVASLFFMKLLNYKMAIIANVIWIGLGTCLVAISSYFLFGEEISLMQLLGILVVVMGLALTSYEPAQKTS